MIDQQHTNLNFVASCNNMLRAGSGDREHVFSAACLLNKVSIEKSRGEVSIVGQDTIENVS